MMGFKGLVIRSYGGQSDRAQVEDLERRCEVGPAKRVFLFTDTLGDPICRIRNSPIYKMLVAQWDNELVGIIQGSIKFVTVHDPPNYVAKLGYILGLRVALHYRHRGVGSSLVRHLEEWFATNDVDFSCMATEKDNDASVNLFINKLRYIKFRTARILVNPVTNRPYHIASETKIHRLKIEEAESMYRKHMASTDFFPKDMNDILRNKLSLGTWVAYYKEDSVVVDFAADGRVPTNWAMLSLWNSGQVFKLRLGKAPFPWRIYTKSLKLMDKAFPCFKLRSVPDFFQPFGFYFLYGLHHEGARSGGLVRALCQYMHNMAMSSAASDCKVIVTEIGGGDGLKEDIPHWKLLSCPEDLWCIKAMKKEERNHLLEWTEAPPTRALFVDPREV